MFRAQTHKLQFQLRRRVSSQSKWRRSQLLADKSDQIQDLWFTVLLIIFEQGFRHPYSLPVRIPIVKYKTTMELATQERASPADARIAPAMVTARQPYRLVK